MTLGTKRLNELTPRDIQGLLGESEGLRLDFKRDPYPPNNNGLYNLCVDVASMANSTGGYLVVGIEEANAIATQIKPMSLQNAQTEANRMRQWCHDWIRPRVPDLEVGPVEAGFGQYLIVVRVPQSVLQPHMVIADRRTQFCRRYQDGNREMTLDEIRTGFLGDATLLGIDELRAGIRQLLRQELPGQPASLATDPNSLRRPREVQEYMERQLQSWKQES